MIRHHLADRLYHWVMAASMLVLLGTGFLPVLGLKFAWIDAHWIAGLLLTVLVAVHAVRALIWQKPKTMLIRGRDLRGVAQAFAWVFRRRAEPPGLPGKYPLPQKLFHHGIALLALLAIGSGIAMLAKIDGPFWTRDPYLFASGTWAVIYILHDLAAMALLSGVMVHLYFAARPEKRWMTRSMLRGWITRADYQAHHDTTLWKAEPLDGDEATGTAAAREG